MIGISIGTIWRRGGGAAAPDAAPSGLALTVISGVRIDATVTINATNADGVSWEYSTDNITFTEHGTSVLGAYSYTGLTQSTFYYFRCRNYLGTQYSAYCTVVTAVTEATVLRDGNTIGWYEFDSGVTQVGGLVSAWADKLGSANTLVQATDAQKPTIGATSIVFTRAFSNMSVAVDKSQPISNYWVIKHSDYISETFIGRGGVSRIYLQQRGTTPQLMTYAGTSLSDPNGDLALNTWGIVRAFYNGASSKLQVNAGVPITTNIGTSGMNALQLGGQSGVGSQFEIKATIWRNAADTEANETAIYNYLYNKFFFLVAEYESVWNAFETKPSYADTVIQGTWMKEMVNRGYYAKAEFLDMFSVHSSDSALVNWKNPGTFNPSLVNAPAFETYKGFTGNETNGSYVNLNFTPSLDGSLIDVDDMCVIIGVGTDLESAKWDFGANDGARAIIMVSKSGATFQSKQGETVGVYNNLGIHHYAMSRNNSTDIDLYVNRKKTTVTSAAPAALCQQVLSACGEGANASSRQLRYAMMFSGLAEAEVLDIIDLTETYLDNYSAGLITTDDSTHPLLSRLTSTTLFTGTAPLDWLGRPVLCVNALGEWVMTYFKAEDHSGTNGVCVLRFSDDEGATWSDENELVDTTAVTPPSVEGGNDRISMNVLIKCPNDDLVALCWQTGGTRGSYQWRSTDDGATWSSEGRILGGLLCDEDYCIVGTDIYMVVRDYPADPENLMLYKSTDNCANWSKVSDIETVLDTNEAGIEYLGGTTLIVVMKITDNSTTYQYISTDLGLNWTRTDIGSQVGIINRPQLTLIGSNLFLFGRDLISTAVEYTGVWVSSNGGTTWSAAFHPTRYAHEDTGYCYMLQRTDGTYYMLSYEGTQAIADIVEYTFEDV